GLESVQSSAVRALQNLLGENLGSGFTPAADYRIERDDGDRVLFSYDVGGRTKVAFIAADDVRDYNGHMGWGIEAWAECDPSELPADAADALGISVWLDRA